MQLKKDTGLAFLILLITTITSFNTAFMGSALNIALPEIGKEFNASALMLSWLSTIYILTTAALLLPAGKLMDIYGRVKFFKYGIIVFTTGSLLCGIAENSFLLLLFRALQGIGSAFIFSSSTALLVSAYPAASRGKAIGINTAAVYTGLSSGPFLGGIITYQLNWRAIFLITVVIGITLIILTYIYLHEELHELSKKKYDYSGAGIYILSIILLMIGVSLFPGLTGFVLLALSFFVFIFFYHYELKREDPIFSFTLFKENKTFTFSNLAALINYSATFAISFLMSFYLQSVKGLTSQNAGLILMTQPVMQALFSPLAGKLSDKIEPQIVASVGMFLLTVGLIIFCFISPGMNMALIISNLAMLGFGFALFSSPNVNAIMSSVDKINYGIASSTLASMRMIGQMLSMGIVIIIFSLFIGGAKINPENQTAFLISAKYAFILFSAFSVVGIFASLSRGKIHKK